MAISTACIAANKVYFWFNHHEVYHVQVRGSVAVENVETVSIAANTNCYVKYNMMKETVVLSIYNARPCRIILMILNL